LSEIISIPIPKRVAQREARKVAHLRLAAERLEHAGDVASAILLDEAADELAHAWDQVHRLKSIVIALNRRLETPA
jgi:hypothetical protein